MPDSHLLVFDGDGLIIGVMYGAPSPTLDLAAPPGSPFVRWHYHHWPVEFCLISAMLPIDAAKDGKCPSGQTPSDHSPLMAHVWLRGDGDMFASDMEGHDHHP